jgi:hypothetical protein
MSKSVSRIWVSFAFLFIFFIFLSACGPTAEQQEKQRLEDSIRLDEERRELLERTGRMLDSISAAPADTL